MRIAFVSPNREQLPDPVVPLGVLYMMGVAGDRHDKSLIDLCFETDPIDSLGRELERCAPDLVAIGMRNIQNADYSDTSATLAYYDEIVRTVRARTNAPIVMGGGGFSIIPGDLARRFGVDYGIKGEGEVAFAQLLERLERGSRDASGIANVYGPDGLPVSPVRPAGRRDFLDIRQSVRPDRSGLSPRYYEHSGIGSIQTKRGCALLCDYCVYPTIEGRVVRQRHADDVADEWHEMLRSAPAIGHVFVVDAVFNLPPEHARQVCRALIDRGIRTPWTCYVNPIRFEQDLADLMARAGCVGVEIGSDSGTDSGLQRLKKGFTTDHIRRTSAVCRRAGIKDCHSWVLGTPGETLEDVERSLDFIEDLDPSSAILMAYKDDHEAVDAELAARLGSFRQRVLEAIERRARPHSRWAVPSTGLRFSPRLFNALRKAGYRGPLWQHAI
jgi:radical SAM superfamily enzyme YgiQ (UPF0313 family)